MDKIKIPITIAQEIIDHLSSNLPEEACGILAGKDGKVSINRSITNSLHSPVRYFMEPMELYQALKFIDEEQLDLLAIYHSHPNGPDRPSETDIKEFLYPGVATIIGFKDNSGWKLKGFIIDMATYDEIDLEMIES